MLLASPHGYLEITVSGNKLKELSFLNDREAGKKKTSARSSIHPFEKKIARKLRDYFDGKNPNFPNEILGWEGVGPFTRRVLEACMKIPYGKTVTYQELAHRIKNPRAARAVGNALGSNRIPIIIPCHRVIRSDNTLGGYTSGLAWKRHLLRLESERR